MDKKKLILVGGGHCHLYLLHRLEKLNKYFNITLVSEEIYKVYSGMVSAYLEDIYKFDEISFNLWKMCEKLNIDFIDGKVTGIEPEKRLLTLQNGNTIYYDTVSFNIGSETNTSDIENSENYGYKTRPLSNIKKIKTDILNSPKNVVKTAIIGGGAAGYEIAAALDNYIHNKERLSKILIVDSAHSILSAFPGKVQKYGRKYLKGKRISYITDKKVISVNENSISTMDNQTIYYDFLIWATGVRSSRIFSDSMLAVDRNGFLKVNDTLQHVYYESIFGCGDCISIQNYEYLKKEGVYPVRQGPILLRNLLNHISDKPLKSYKPRKNFLKIISAGNKKGILRWKKICLKGKMVWRLKNSFDSRYMKKTGTIK